MQTNHKTSNNHLITKRRCLKQSFEWKFWCHYIVVFTLSSLIATICCIMMSPHFPETRDDESGEDDVFDQDDAYEDFSFLDIEEYNQNYSYSFYTLDSWPLCVLLANQNKQLKEYGWKLFKK